MKRYYKFTLLCFLIFFIKQTGIGQNHPLKSLEAVRVTKAPKIDGNPNDVQWQKAHVATGFYMYAPGDGDTLPPEFDTKVKVVYDDAALYILAEMKDPEPEKIPLVFGLRDQFIQADYFSVVINPFSTPNNNYLFLVNSSGSQIDGNQPNGKDVSWNAVWKSKTKITNNGWIVEMAIPYSALRFQNDNNQTWSIGFFRHIDRIREDYSWTYLDKSKSGDLVQFLGKLTDLQNLKPPVRLSLYPYMSVVHNRFAGQNTTNFGFGMDLKYGLSESYTLDATLVPDFSDTPYDELELNLGPFEQFYQEKRQFFTEGFDLFNKGHLFYSRRIGGTPSLYKDITDMIDEQEEVVDNPEKVQLINALKISGRNKNGLGIGFFNAITNETAATVKNLQTGNERQIITEPYANYNIFVADYNFKGNSSVSFINTNVIRQGKFRDANVTGLRFDLYGQNNTFNLLGSTAMSLINENEDFSKGFRYFLKGSKKIKGHRFSAQIRAQDTHFDNNDLGFNRSNNYAKFDVSYSYGILKPTKHFNNLSVSFDAGFDRRYTHLDKIQNDFELDVFLTDKKYLSYGFGLVFVTDAFDYYEPRVEGRYFLDKAHGGGWAFLSTDYRKKFAIDIKLKRFTKFNDAQNFFGFSISPRLRFGNRFNLKYQLNFDRMQNAKGYVDLVNNDIIFGNRQQQTAINSLNANYFFNTKSAVSLNFRYYWAPVHYDTFYILQDNGTLIKTDAYNENNDINYNVLNLDLGYTWEFAPGSNLSLLYRRILTNYDQLAQISFSENLDNLIAQPMQNTFIMKMTYYIDYNAVKNKLF